MDSFEWNKILGAVLGGTLLIAALNILVDEFMKPEKPTTTGVTVAVVETPTDGTPTAAAKPDWGTVLPVAGSWPEAIVRMVAIAACSTVTLYIVDRLIRLLLSAAVSDE